MEGLGELIIWIVKQIVKNPIRALKYLATPVLLVALLGALTESGSINDRLRTAAISAAIGLVIGLIVLYLVSSDDE
jgi:hypothetical protein